MNTTGTATKPKVYKLLSYSYFEKGDYANAQKFLNDYFTKEKPDQVISKDYVLQSAIYSKTGGSNEDIKNAIFKGVALDTVMTSKIDILKAAADSFKAKGDSLSRIVEGDIRVFIIKTKPNPSQRDYFDAGLAYYQGKAYAQSDSIFKYYTEKWPEEIFGWQMEFSIQRALDTAMTLGLAVPYATKYLEVLEKDTAKNKKTIIGVAGYLAQYYANIAKDRDKAIVYLEKMVMYDPANADFKKYLDDMKKPPKAAPKGNPSPANSNTSPGKPKTNG